MNQKVKVTFLLKMGAEVVFPIAKGWLAIATLKPTFTFLGKDFAIFNTLTWENLFQEK